MEKEKSEAQIKLETKVNKVNEFCNSIHVGIVAKIMASEDGIRPTIAFIDSEKYEEVINNS